MRRERDDITSIILHCAATPDGVSHTAVDIDSWHKERGFRRSLSAMRSPGDGSPALGHIGYHRVILIDGTIEAGRSLAEVGAHCAGRNRDSVGVCLVGTRAFTLAQWDALCGLLFDLEAAVGHALELHGHNEFSSKICPGFDVQAWVGGGFVPPAGSVL